MRISDWSSDVCSSDLVEKGLQRKPWVKTTLAPGSKVVSDYYEKSGLTPYLDKLGFNLVGYRSEERRVGHECVSTCSSRWLPSPYKNNRVAQDLYSLAISKLSTT